MLSETSRTGWMRPRSVLNATFRPSIWRSGFSAMGSFSLIEPAELGVERVAQGFADEVIREDGEENGHPREDGDPPGEVAAGPARLVEHPAPARLLHEAETEKAQDALGEDRRRDAEAGGDE